MLGALQCHMDVQVRDGRALILQHAASYASKFSDQLAARWLNDEASDCQLPRNVLSKCQPLKPKMYLQRSSHKFGL